MKVEIDQTVWYIKIDNAVKENSYTKNGIKIEELKIIGISKYYICLNNDYFTTIDLEREGVKKERSYRRYLGDVSVSIRTGDSILGDGVFISLYSTKKPTKRMLKKMIGAAANKIQSKYGFLSGGAQDLLHTMVDNYKL